MMDMSNVADYDEFEKDEKTGRAYWPECRYDKHLGLSILPDGRYVPNGLYIDGNDGCYIIYTPNALDPIMRIIEEQGLADVDEEEEEYTDEEIEAFEREQEAERKAAQQRMIQRAVERHKKKLKKRQVKLKRVNG